MSPSAARTAPAAPDRKFCPRDALVPLVAAVALMLLSRINFLWFHTFAELFSVVIGVSLYLIASQSYVFNRNGLLLFLAQGFFWAACIDAIHAMVYSGMGLVPGDDANPPTQLWLIARMIEAVTLLLAPRYLGDRQLPPWSFTAFGTVAALAVGLVFAGHLPAVFVPGQGLTPLKIGAEYLIIGLLAAAGWHLLRRRSLLDAELHRVLLGVIALTIASEFAFTIYVSVYGLSNLVGHILKFWAFWLLLLAISRWMIADPFRLLSRDATSFDTVPIPVLQVDPDGTIQSCNEAARALRPDGGIGRPLHAVWHPAALAAADCPVCQALREDRAIETDLFDAQQAQWFAVHLKPVRRENGTQGFVCVQKDVSESRRAREALIALNQEIQDLYDRAPCAYHSLDANGIIVNINQTELDMLGYTRAEVVNRMPFTDLLTPASRELFRRSFPAFKERGHANDLEFELVRKDGSTFVANLSATAIRDAEGNYMASRSTFMDISRHKQAEERLIHAEKMEAIGQLTGGLAHDFNNLLGIILGSLDLLAPRLGDDDKARRHHDLAVRAARRAAEVTRSLLAVARKQALEPRNLAIDEALAELMPLIKQSAGTAITVSLSPCTSCRGLLARVDPAGLGNALLNLVINARDAMPAGGDLMIDIRLQTIAPGDMASPLDLAAGQYIVISVSDNGCGMPPEVAAKAFQPFFTTKETGKGTGLGLAMVYGFARQSGGTATVYSRPQVGTTVRLYLPAVVDAMADKTAADTAALLTGTGQRILLVDDEQGLLDVARAWLEGLGYRVSATTSPAEALDRLAAEPCDLLLTDLMMPGGIDGIALAGKATALRPTLPILLSSGFAGDMVHAAWPLLQKPYSQAELAREVARLLSPPASDNPSTHEVAQ